MPLFVGELVFFWGGVFGVNGRVWGVFGEFFGKLLGVLLESLGVSLFGKGREGGVWEFGELCGPTQLRTGVWGDFFWASLGRSWARVSFAFFFGGGGANEQEK